MFIVEITPAAADAWSAFRWAEKAVAVDGNAYEGGILKNPAVGTITNRADILGGGAAASTDSLTIELIDKRPTQNNPLNRRLSELLQAIDVEGRAVSIWIAMDSVNMVRNGSFERGTGITADEWTRTSDGGGSGNDTSRQSAQKTHGSWGLLIGTDDAAPAPHFRSATTQIKHYKNDLVVRLDARGSIFGVDDEAKIAINIDGLYWNPATPGFQAGYVDITHATTASFLTFETIVDLSKLTSPSGDQVPFWVELTTDDRLNALYYFDAVYAEVVHQGVGSAGLKSYHVNRLDYKNADDLFKVYSGEVIGHPWRMNQIKLRTRSKISQRHRDVPVTLVSSRFAKNWDIDPETEGKPFPMTYGDMFLELYGDDPGAATPTVYRELDEASGLQIVPRQAGRALARGVIVNKRINPRATDLSAEAQLYFDRPGMTLNAFGSLYHFDTDANRYVKELLEDNFPNPATSEWDQGLADASLTSATDAIYVRGGQIPLSLYQRMNDLIWTSPDTLALNPHAVGHGNPTTKMTSIRTGGPAYPTLLQNFKFNMDSIRLHDVHLKAAYIVACVKILGAHSAGDAQIRFYIGNAGLNQALTILNESGEFNNSPFVSDHATISPTHGETELGLALTSGRQSLDYWNEPNDPGGSGPSRIIPFLINADEENEVYDLALRLDLTIPMQDFIPFIACKGREYLDTWGARKTSGNLIENPADIVEGFFRDELTVAGAGINTSVFDTCNTDRSAWKGAGQLIDSRRSELVVDSFCESFATVYWNDVDGLENLKALKYQATADRILTPRDFALNSIKADHTRREDIYNEFTVNWGYHVEIEEYMSQAWVSRHGTSLVTNGMDYVDRCRESYDLLGGRENRMEFEARWIQDKPTAELLLKFLVDWNRLRRMTITGDAWLDQVELEVGDVVGFAEFERHAKDIDAKRFVLMRTSLSKRNGTIRQDFLEVHDPAIVSELVAWRTAEEIEITHA